MFHRRMKMYWLLLSIFIAGGCAEAEACAILGKPQVYGGASNAVSIISNGPCCGIRNNGPKPVRALLQEALGFAYVVDVPPQQIRTFVNDQGACQQSGFAVRADFE